jgi:hypothetical protein
VTQPRTAKKQRDSLGLCGDDHFALGVSLFEVAESFGGFSERVASIDYGVYFFGFEQALRSVQDDNLFQVDSVGRSLANAAPMVKATWVDWWYGAGD